MIKDLHANQGSVEVSGEITDVTEPKSFTKFGTQGKVASATLKDKTGTVTLTLWNDQVDQFKKGDTVKITNGYVKEWQGELQISTGKFGKIEKI
ncbi:hypothetical protein C4573_00755 [Candidatus Woesearchaeota archaeon]|nr:MAG: hypothetical protein C4573_00755 [Candidatus Woesearchaeota archaeon]